MKFTGLMQDIDDAGLQDKASYSFSFTLAGKHFQTSLGLDETDSFRKLANEIITLETDYNPIEEILRDDILSRNTAAPHPQSECTPDCRHGLNAYMPPGQTLEEFSNNEDHCFIESLELVTKNHFRIFLGS